MLAATGTMRGAVELYDDGPHPWEVFHFRLAEDSSAAFVLYRAAFEGAAWEAGALTIALGALELTIEPCSSDPA